VKKMITRLPLLLLVIIVCTLLSKQCHAFVGHHKLNSRGKCVEPKRLSILHQTPEDVEAEERQKIDTKREDLGLKAAWYSTEIFGEIASFFSSGSTQEANGKEAQSIRKSDPLSRSDAIRLLREDYDRDYFVSGKLHEELYEDDCEFADPFVSFKGLQRFKKNLDNLGAFMQDVNIDVYDWNETEEGIVRTKWRFRCVLGLPWRPILAARGGTDHYFSQDTGRMYLHYEGWEIEPLDALKQILRPNPKLFKK